MTPTLRLATAEDAPAVRRIYAPFVEDSTVSFESHPPTEAEVGTRIATTTERYPWLVCALDETVGYAYAGIALPNPASTGFHESMGFEPVGTYHGVGYKRGNWHDVRWYEKTLGDRPADPDPPVAFPDLDASTIERALETGGSLLD